MTWQPIETAPKGEPGDLVLPPEVDVWSGRSRYPNCCYEPDSGYWVMRVRYLDAKNRRITKFVKIANPTHWQPLPEPPEEDGARGCGDAVCFECPCECDAHMFGLEA